MNKQRVLKLIRSIAITVVTLIILIAGAGVGYTWYMGQQPVEPAAIQVPVVTKQSTFGAPIKPSPDAPVGASVQMIASPVVPGSNTTITVKTTPTAVCTITAKYNEIASKDSGLYEKTADDYGMVSWTWTVEDSVPLGTWPVTATCTYTEKTGVVRADLVVKDKLDE